MAVWVNATRLRMEELRGHPVLVEFWDFCRPNSIRTLPYVTAWHERYHEAGLVVIGVHSAGFAPGSSPRAVKEAVARLGIEYPVFVDSALEVWREYDNLGWPARYLFGADGMLCEYHFGEGAYAETERAIQELLGDTIPHPSLLEPVRPEDAPDAVLAVQSDDVGEWTTPGGARLLNTGCWVRERGLLGDPARSPYRAGWVAWLDGDPAAAPELVNVLD
jgi:thiol-disulfide isomerase/thioredoxin